MALQMNQANRKGIELKCNFVGFPDDNYFVDSDCQRLMQVLLNLQSNAIKFTHKGSVTIKVELQ